MMSLYRSLFPICFLAFMFVALPFSKKVRQGFRLRRQRLKSSNLPRLEKCLWIHASSGEYEYARPLIVKIKESRPETPVVVTFFSPSYVHALDKDPLIDYALPLPFDFPGAVQSFIKRINPKALLIARTDLWAEVLHQCHRFHIPTILFSYYQSPVKPFGAQFVRKWLLGKVTHVDCVNEDTANQLLKLKATTVSSYGDTRFDRVTERLTQPKPLPFSLAEKRVMVFGSTWPEDEKVCLPSLKDTQKSWDLAVIAPHEPSKAHVESLKKKLNKLGLSYELFSEVRSEPTKQVLIVDQVGFLFDLYQFAEVAFVGGSFKKSVHSVMEPLAHGAKVVLGPHIYNNAESLEFQELQMEGLSALQVVQSSKEMNKAIEDHFNLSIHKRSALRLFIRKEAEKRSGATDQLLKRLDHLLS